MPAPGAFVGRLRPTSLALLVWLGAALRPALAEPSEPSVSAPLPLDTSTEPAPGPEQLDEPPVEAGSNAPDAPDDAPDVPPETPSATEAPTDAPASTSPSDVDEPPPPVEFPRGEAPAGEVETAGPTRDTTEAPTDGYDDRALVETPSVSRRSWDYTLGVQHAWLAEQLAPGFVAAFGYSRFWLDLETAAVFTLLSAPEIDGNYLGQRFGLGAAYAPLDGDRFRVRLGVGGDAYALWGIHAEEWKVALALRADVTFWATKHFGVELGARGYPLSSDGLGVERGPGGIEWLPFFFTTSLHFRSPGERR